MPVTIKDIARTANVSTATVSNVLTKKKFVSPELEERVSKAIKKLNYRPNSYARNLKVNRSNHIGVLVPDITNPFFAEIVKYIQRIMNRNNYQIVLSSSDNDPKREFQIIDSFLNTGVDGIVNIASRMTDLDLEALVNVPMVIVDRPAFYTEANIAFVYADNYRGSVLMAEHFVKKGYTKFVCFAGPVDKVPNARNRLDGFMNTLKKHGFTEDDCELFYSDFLFDSGYKTMEQFLQNYDRNPVRAAFISSDIMAWGAMEAVKTHNLKIPRDIGIAGYDNIYFSNFVYPKLTTVENPTKDLGTNAANLILDALERQKNFSGVSIVLQSPLIVRNSC